MSTPDETNPWFMTIRGVFLQKSFHLILSYGTQLNSRKRGFINPGLTLFVLWGYLVEPSKNDRLGTSAIDKDKYRKGHPSYVCCCSFTHLTRAYPAQIQPTYPETKTNINGSMVK